MEQPYRRILDPFVNEHAYALTCGKEENYAPYLPEAVALWQDLLSRHPCDSVALHHLAIAEHAQAFDLESRGDPDANTHWKQALEYWARLIAAPQFWIDLVQQGQAAGDSYSPATVPALQRQLPEALLNVHLGFARRCFHIDLAAARRHLTLMEESPFDASLRVSLIERLFEDLIGAVEVEQLHGQQLEQAFDNVDRFLELTPNFPRGWHLAAQLTNRLNDLAWASMQAQNGIINDQAPFMQQMDRHLSRCEPWLHRLKAHFVASPSDIALDGVQVREALAEQFFLRGLVRSALDVADSEHDNAHLASRLQTALDCFGESARWDTRARPRSAKEIIRTSRQLLETHARSQAESRLDPTLQQAREALRGNPDIQSLETLSELMRITIRASQKKTHSDWGSLLAAPKHDAEHALSVIRVCVHTNQLESAELALTAAQSRFPQNELLAYWRVQIDLLQNRLKDAEKGYQELLSVASPKLQTAVVRLGEEISQQMSNERTKNSVVAIMDDYHASTGRLAVAIRRLEELSQTSEPTPESLIEIVLAFRNLGCQRQASHCWKKFWECATDKQREEWSEIDDMLSQSNDL